MATDTQIIDCIPNGAELNLLGKIGDRGYGLTTVASDALSLANDPACDLSKLASLVITDPILATDFLRVANSARFQSEYPVTVLKSAVARLGQDYARHIISAHAMSTLVSKVSADKIAAATRLRKRAVMNGVISQYINASWSLGFEGAEYSAGLLHDIGLVLALACSDTIASSYALEIDEELAELGTDHTRIGYLFAVNNAIPTDVCECILNHHSPEHVASEPLVALVATAEHMTNFVVAGGTPTEYDVMTNDAMALLSQLTGEQIQKDLELGIIDNTAGILEVADQLSNDSQFNPRRA